MKKYLLSTFAAVAAITMASSANAQTTYFDDMYAELIGDGVHVSKVAATILARLKGKDRLISITDSNRCKGLPLGKVNLFGRNIIVCEDGVARLEDGTIAGSASCLNQILKNEIENFGFEEDLAINSVTCNPARMLGIDDEVGYNVHMVAERNLSAEQKEGGNT